MKLEVRFRCLNLPKHSPLSNNNPKILCMVTKEGTQADKKFETEIIENEPNPWFITPLFITYGPKTDPKDIKLDVDVVNYEDSTHLVEKLCGTFTCSLDQLVEAKGMRLEAEIFREKPIRAGGAKDAVRKLFGRPYETVSPGLIQICAEPLNQIKQVNNMNLNASSINLQFEELNAHCISQSTQVLVSMYRQRPDGVSYCKIYTSGLMSIVKFTPEKALFPVVTIPMKILSNMDLDRPVIVIWYLKLAKTKELKIFHTGHIQVNMLFDTRSKEYVMTPEVDEDLLQKLGVNDPLLVMNPEARHRINLFIEA